MKNNVKRALALLGIGLLTYFAYSNHFHNGFHFDDMHTIVDNLYIRDISNIPVFFKDATTTSTLPLNQAYRPGLTTLNAIDFYLSGETIPNPFVFHVSIFISYLLLGLLCFFLFLHLLNQSLESKYNSIIAIFTTTWFLLHTANAETINYIIARSDSFSTLMIVLSFILYLFFPKTRNWHLYFIPCFLGFFVKEPSLMFVPLLFVYKLFFEQQLAVKDWVTKLPLLWHVFKQILIPFILCILLFVISRIFTPVIWQSGGTSSLHYLLTQPFVLFHYTYNFLLPLNLVVDTDWTVISNFRQDEILAGLLFVFALLFFACKTSLQQKTRPIAFGIAWFFIALIPSSSIIPFAEVLNDHRTFFPYIGFFIACACILRNALSVNLFLQKGLGKILVIIGAVCLLGGHGYGTYQRNKVWKTEENLWLDATIKAPKNGRALMNYGLTLMERGDYNQALVYFNKTTALLPDYPYVFINIAIAQSRIGDNITAEMNFKKAISLGSIIPESYTFYGRFLLEQGRTIDARNILQTGLKISPKHQRITDLLAAVADAEKLKSTTVDNSMEAILASIKKAPTPEKYLDLSLQYYTINNYQKCIEAALEALKLKPNYDLAYNNICAAYNRLGIWDKAIEAGKKGLQINPSNNQLRANLNESYNKRK